jgi:hypothetical protein
MKFRKYHYLEKNHDASKTGETMKNNLDCNICFGSIVGSETNKNKFCEFCDAVLCHECHRKNQLRGIQEAFECEFCRLYQVGTEIKISDACLSKILFSDWYLQSRAL